MSKCEWKDGVFVPCQTHMISVTNRWGNTEIKVHAKWLGIPGINFCPFCGADIRKPEPKVWECKIVIAGDSSLPHGFDGPPRMAAQKAIEDAGFKVITNFSGWGGRLTDAEQKCVEDDIKRNPSVEG